MDCQLSYKTCDSIHRNQKSWNDQFCDQSWPDDFDNIFCIQCESHFSCSSMQRGSRQLCSSVMTGATSDAVLLLCCCWYPWQSPPHRAAEHHIVTLAGRMMPLSMEQLDTVLHPTIRIHTFPLGIYVCTKCIRSTWIWSTSRMWTNSAKM